MKRLCLVLPCLLFCACLAGQTSLPAPSVLEEERPQTPPNAYLRAAWIATVDNIDWPSKPGLPAKTQQKEFTDLLDTLQALGFNAVFVQIRPTADTFWPSELEPWSRYLTGTQGKDPGYDPLDFMIKETHGRGMQFHAWLNPYRVSQNGKAALAKEHPAVQNPSWTLRYGGRLYFNPALPQVQKHVANIVAEVVRNYDVDGIHFDDYFYPYPVKENKKNVPFPDQDAYRRYGRGKNLHDWRRANVNALIKRVHDEIKALKPAVRFGISPFGVWRNKSKDPTGSDTRAFSAYDDGLYADSRAWMQNGWIDYIIPQLYWHFGHKAAPFGTLLDWWCRETAKYPDTAFYVGLGAYQQEKTWKDPLELQKQIQALPSCPGVKGEVYFSAASIQKSPSIQKTLQTIKRAPL